ncbi:MAG: haloacid dehalogenase [Rhodocyclaceae bacterium]|nr:MAG: haloacid dehalogenase [Rhodocyclaceae bacterium]
MSLIDYEVITLGCYGTLIDKVSGVYGALRPMLDKAATKLRRDDVWAAFRRHELALEVEAPGMPYADILIEVHRRLAKEWYVIASEDDHRLFGLSVPDWPMFADTPAALQYLKRYFKLAILSDIDSETFSGSQRRLGIKFDAIFTAHEIGSYKPNPRSFDYMLEKLGKLGVNKRHILYAADCSSNGHRLAASKGLATACIDRQRETIGRNATLAPIDAACCDFRFASMANLVMAHQEHLRA